MNTDELATAEIGCEHTFGVVHECPNCGTPRHLFTDDRVTARFFREKYNEPHWSEAEAADQSGLRAALERYRLAYIRRHSANDGECEHGFGPPATGCPNTDCDEAELQRAWNALAASAEPASEPLDADEREAAMQAIGGFLWLGNNLHNVEADALTFRQFFAAALEDAREVYDRLRRPPVAGPDAGERE